MAVQNSIYQFLSNFGKNLVAANDAAAARTQLEFTATGSALATAADQQAARTAIGLGSSEPAPVDYELTLPDSSGRLATIGDIYEAIVESGPLDSSTISYLIAIPGSLPGNKIRQINSLVTGLKAAGTWDKKQAIYPFPSSDPAINAINLRNPGTNSLTYTGALTHGSSGVTMTGPGGANTGLIVGDTSTRSMTLYVKAVTSGSWAAVGAVDPLDDDRRFGMTIFPPDNKTRAHSGGAFTGGTAEAIIGSNPISGCLATATVGGKPSLLRNGVELATSWAANGDPLVLDLPLHVIGASGQSSWGWYDGTTSYADTGLGLTLAEHAAEYPVIQAYNDSLAIQSPIYQALSNFGKNFVAAVDAAAARVQLGFTATGSAIATAADQPAARAALGLGSIATQDANAVAITGGSATGLASVVVSGTTPSVNPQTGAMVVSGGLGVGGDVNIAGSGNFETGGSFNFRIVRRFLMTQSFFAYNEGDFPGIAQDIVFDRLWGATSKYVVTTTGISSIGDAFDASAETFSQIPANTTAVIEIDYSAVYPIAPNCRSGLIWINVYTSIVAREPENVKIYLWDTSTSSWRLAAESSPAKVYPAREPLLISLSQAVLPIGSQKIRFEIKSQGSFPCYISGISWFPSRISSFDQPRHLTHSSASPQRLWGGISAEAGPISPAIYTVAGLQAGITGQRSGSIAHCSNESGGSVPVFFEGTNWRRMTDRAITS